MPRDISDLVSHDVANIICYKNYGLQDYKCFDIHYQWSCVTYDVANIICYKNYGLQDNKCFDIRYMPNNKSNVCMYNKP